MRRPGDWLNAVDVAAEVSSPPLALHPPSVARRYAPARILVVIHACALIYSDSLRGIVVGDEIVATMTKQSSQSYVLTAQCVFYTPLVTPSATGVGLLNLPFLLLGTVQACSMSGLKDPAPAAAGATIDSSATDNMKIYKSIITAIFKEQHHTSHSPQLSRLAPQGWHASQTGQW